MPDMNRPEMILENLNQCFLRSSQTLDLNHFSFYRIKLTHTLTPAYLVPSHTYFLSSDGLQSPVGHSVIRLLLFPSELMWICAQIFNSNPTALTQCWLWSTITGLQLKNIWCRGFFCCCFFNKIKSYTLYPIIAQIC